MIWWFLLGILAGHLFWVVVWCVYWYRLTRGDREMTEQAHQDVREIRERIRQRMAGRN